MGKRQIDPKLANQGKNANKNAKVKKEKCRCPATPNFIFILPYLVSISMIVVGAVYFGHKHCPAENIALLLVIGGIISLVGSFVSQLMYCTNTTIESDTSNSDQVIIVQTSTTRIELIEKTSVGKLSADGDRDSIDSGRGGVIVKETTCCPISVNMEKGISPRSPGQWALKCLSMLLDLAFICIFIATCVLVFRLYPNVEYEHKGDMKNYCNPGLFLFTFVYLLVVFSIMILLLVTCCLCCSYCNYNLAALTQDQFKF